MIIHLTCRLYNSDMTARSALATEAQDLDPFPHFIAKNQNVIGTIRCCAKFNRNCYGCSLHSVNKGSIII